MVKGTNGLIFSNIFQTISHKTNHCVNNEAIFGPTTKLSQKRNYCLSTMKVRYLKTEMKKREKKDLHILFFKYYPFIELMRSIDFRLTQGLFLKFIYSEKATKFCEICPM